MPTDKHLVLDPDVHEGLKSRKRISRATVREIGNTILRSALDHPPLSDAIADKLISAGKISAADYYQAKAEAIQETDALHIQVSDLLHATDHGTFVAGSWEIRLGAPEPDSRYQLFDVWAIDGDRKPLPLHCHEESAEYCIVLQGRVLVSMEEKEVALEAGECFHTLPGEPHSTTPLTADTRAVFICSPPDPSLSSVRSTDSA